MPYYPYYPEERRESERCPRSVRSYRCYTAHLDRNSIAFALAGDRLEHPHAHAARSSFVLIDQICTVTVVAVLVNYVYPVLEGSETVRRGCLARYWQMDFGRIARKGLTWCVQNLKDVRRIENGNRQAEEVRTVNIAQLQPIRVLPFRRCTELLGKYRRRHVAVFIVV